MVASLDTGIVTTPTLFGLDPSELVEDADAAAMEDIRDKKTKERQGEAIASSTISEHFQRLSRPISDIRFTHYESVDDLIEDTSGERFVRTFSPFAWVQLDEDRYMLSDRSGDYLKVHREDEMWRVSFLVKAPFGLSKSPYLKARIIASTRTFEDAIHAADTFAKEKFPYQIVSKNAAWRKQPATEAQLTALNKTRGPGNLLTPETTSKGKAMDMITKIKHGAKARFGKIKIQQRKADQVQQKRRDFLDGVAKQQVEVGPVQ